MLRSIKTNQRLERHLAFHLDGTGTAALDIGSDLATLTDNGTGDYTITLNKPFARVPIVITQPITTAIKSEPANVAVGSFDINTFDEATGATPTDADVYIIVIGWDTSDEYAEES